MKLALVLASCLALLGCDKKKDAAPKPSAPVAGAAAAAGGSAAAGTTAAGTPAGGTTAAAGSAAGAGTGNAAVDPAAVDGVKIPWAGHAVGDKSGKVEDRIMKASIEPKPGVTVEATTVEHREETREVLAVDGGMLTKAKISYLKQSINETMGGESREKPTPTLGKTYLVWREGGELKVTLEDGSAPSPAELKVVKKGNRGVGKPDAMEAFISGRTWKVGELVQLDPAQLTAIGEAMADDGSKLSSMSFTLKEVTDSTASFEMAIAMGGATDEGGEMKVEMKGLAIVDRKTGSARSLDLSGPFAGTAGKALLKISGTMSGKTVYTY